MYALDSTFVPTPEVTAGVAWANYASSNKLGFASPYVLAFEQDAQLESATATGNILAELKNLFGQVETVNDRLKKAVESRLTIMEQRELARQEKEFRKRQLNSLQTGIGLSAYAPNLADYALIAKRDQMLRDAEHEICKQVRDSMTLAEKKELKRQFVEYLEAVKAYMDSPVFKLRPQPGPAVTRFYLSVKRAVARLGDRFDA